MKRRTTQPKKRKDRASGMSPYARYGKVPYQYSGAYQAWRHGIVSHTSHVEAIEADRHRRERERHESL